MTQEQYKYYLLGLKQEREDELMKINSKLHSLKYDLLAQLNEPMDLRSFEMITAQMISLLKQQLKLKEEIDNAIS